MWREFPWVVWWSAIPDSVALHLTTIVFLGIGGKGEHEQRPACRENIPESLKVSSGSRQARRAVWVGGLQRQVWQGLRPHRHSHPVSVRPGTKATDTFVTAALGHALVLLASPLERLCTPLGIILSP